MVGLGLRRNHVEGPHHFVVLVFRDMAVKDIPEPLPVSTGVPAASSNLAMIRLTIPGMARIVSFNAGFRSDPVAGAAR